MPIIGTSVDSIDIAEDRERFAELDRPNSDCKQPANGTAVDTAAGAARGPARSASRCSCGPASCSAAGT